MSRDENLLRRWSRLKQEATAKAALAGNAEVAAAPAGLPPLEGLSFESDFRAFMSAKVDEGIRRAALKKLFSDPRFNVMDGLDVYIDDYTREDPIPTGMLAQLQHARSTLFGTPSQENPPEDKALAEARPAAPPDESGTDPNGACT